MPLTHPYPNLLFVLTDDQAAWAMGAYGNRDIHTPTMDRVAREGARFAQAFTSPVCSPSRVMTLTGRHAHQVGVTDWIAPRESLGVDPKAPLLSEALRDAGYSTGLIGKWHLGKEPQFHPLRRGFDEFWGFLGGNSRPRDAALWIDGEERTVDGFLIDRMADEGLAFLHRHAGRPFALFFHTREPHQPYLPAPEEDRAHYEGRSLRVPSGTGIPEERLQEEHRNYYASITSVDRNLGRLLAELEALGVAERTIVVVMGDNGYMLGQHGLETKGNAWRFGNPRDRRPNMFDDSIRVPLVIRWPEGTPPGLVRDEMVTSLDLFPTFLEILRESGSACREAPSPEGRSLLPLLRGEAPPWRDDVCMLYDMHHGAVGRMRMARTRDWKLVEHYEEGGAHELYHLATDTGEERNLYGDAAAAAARDELTARLRAWQRRERDPLV